MTVFYSVHFWGHSPKFSCCVELKAEVAILRPDRYTVIVPTTAPPLPAVAAAGQAEAEAELARALHWLQRATGVLVADKLRAHPINLPQPCSPFVSLAGTFFLGLCLSHSVCVSRAGSRLDDRLLFIFHHLCVVI